MPASPEYKKQVLNAYREAYMKVYGTEPSIIESGGGWFWVQEEGARWRLSQMEVKTRELLDDVEPK